MKYLLLDKLQRLKWVWIVMCVCYLIIGLIVPDFRQGGNHSMFTWMVYLIGVPGWLAELGYGYARVALTLPFTARTIGRFLWYLGVAMPTLALAIFGGLGILIRLGSQGFGNGMFTLWLQMVFLGGLLFGSSFWIFSGPPLPRASKIRPSQKENVAYALGFAAAVAAFGFWLYYAPFNGQTKYALICLPCLVFTFLGWNRAEGLLVDYGGYRPTAVGEVKSSVNFRSPSGYGGIRFLLAGAFARQVFILLALLLGIGTLFLVIVRGGWVPFAAAVAMLPVFAFVLSIGEVGRVLTQVRYLRALPLTSKQWAGVLLSVQIPPFLLSAATGVIAATLNPSLPSPWVLAKTYLLFLAPLCVVSALAVWNSENWAGRIVMAVILLVVSAFPAIYEVASGDPGWPLAFIILYPFAALIAVLFIICRLLERNDMTYRFRPLMMKQG